MTDTQFPPSYFANIGNPSCSIWGKSEIEWIALAYVRALANDGDTWKKITREQAYNLLSDEQKKDVYGFLSFDHYQDWFDMVSEQLSDAEGAFGVRGFWFMRS